MQMHVRRVERDEILIASLNPSVGEFLEEVAAKVASLTALYPSPLGAAA